MCQLSDNTHRLFRNAHASFFHEIGASVSLLKFFCLQVDKHIRRLDTDLARFEADLKEKQIESTDYDSTSSKGKKGVYVCARCLGSITSLYFGPEPLSPSCQT